MKQTFGMSAKRRLYCILASVSVLVIATFGVFYIRNRQRDISVIWTAYVSGGIADDSMAWVPGTLFVSTYGGDIVALDDATGNTRWHIHRAGGVNASGVNTVSVDVGANRIYIGCSGSVEAIDANSGKSIWAVPIRDAQCAVPAGLGIIFIGAVNVQARDKTTGRKIWTVKTNGSINGMAVGDQTVYVSAMQPDNQTYAIDATSGRVIWRSPHGSVMEPVLVNKQSIIVAGADQELYALNLHDGRVLWKCVLPSALYYSAAVGGDSVYITEYGGRVYRLRASDGSIIWSMKVGQHIRGAPVAIGNQLYIGAGLGGLYVLSNDHGDIQRGADFSTFAEWLSPGNGIVGACVNSPVIGNDGDVFLSTSYGKVYHLRFK